MDIKPKKHFLWILMTPKGVEIIKELLTKNEKKDEKTFISIDSRY